MFLRQVINPLTFTTVNTQTYMLFYVLKYVKTEVKGCEEIFTVFENQGSLLEFYRYCVEIRPMTSGSQNKML